MGRIGEKLKKAEEKSYQRYVTQSRLLDSLREVLSDATPAVIVKVFAGLGIQIKSMGLVSFSVDGNPVPVFSVPSEVSDMLDKFRKEPSCDDDSY